MPDNKIHSLRSSHREALLEHLFAGEIMRRLWIRGEWRLEVLKPQVDDGGYDLVLEANTIRSTCSSKATKTGIGWEAGIRAERGEIRRAARSLELGRAATSERSE